MNHFEIQITLNNYYEYIYIYIYIYIYTHESFRNTTTYMEL